MSSKINRPIKRIPKSEVEKVILTKINSRTCPLVERLVQREKVRRTNASLNGTIRKVEKRNKLTQAHSKEQAIRLLFR